MINVKKGAMFGLDARIALAIFGALSVISGAALYSAIQNSRVTSLVVELNEMGKAVEQYILDTGTDLSQYAVTTFYFKDLVKKPASVTNWNGPYISLPGSLVANDYEWNHSAYGHALVRNLENDLGGANYTTCTSSPCYYWLQIGGLTTELIKAVDLQVDGKDDKAAGNIRYIDADLNTIFLKGPLVLNQP